MNETEIGKWLEEHGWKKIYERSYVKGLRQLGIYTHYLTENDWVIFDGSQEDENDLEKALDNGPPIFKETLKNILINILVKDLQVEVSEDVELKFLGYQANIDFEYQYYIRNKDLVIGLRANYPEKGLKIILAKKHKGEIYIQSYDLDPFSFDMKFAEDTADDPATYHEFRTVIKEIEQLLLYYLSTLTTEWSEYL